MISLEQQTRIHASQEVVWAFLIDISHSLSFNRFHTTIELLTGYSIKKGSKFIIHHNLGLGSLKMNAEVLHCSPPCTITILEHCAEHPEKGFRHEYSFKIVRDGDDSILHYSLEGTFSNPLRNLPFHPILKGVMISELSRIKQAIESSEPNSAALETQGNPSI